MAFRATSVQYCWRPSFLVVVSGAGCGHFTSYGLLFALLVGCCFSSLPKKLLVMNVCCFTLRLTEAFGMVASLARQA